MDTIKKTFVKYFVAEDKTLSLTALSASALTIIVTVIMVKELWPLSVDDVMKISGAITGGTMLLGFRKAMKK